MGVLDTILESIEKSSQLREQKLKEQEMIEFQAAEYFNSNKLIN